MDKNLVFCIDCDEVLRSTLGNMVRIYNEEIGDDMKYEDVKSFDVSVSFPRIEEETGIPPREWFFDCHSEELFLNSKPIKGVKKAIDILKKYGTVVILTYQRSCENKLHTIEWLCKNKLMCDDVCFLKQKRLMRCDYLIDDNEDNFKGSHAKNAILITAPYNDRIVEIPTEDGSTYAEDCALINILENSYCESAERYKSLLEFAKMIDNEFNLKTL